MYTEGFWTRHKFLVCLITFFQIKYSIQFKFNSMYIIKAQNVSKAIIKYKWCPCNNKTAYSKDLGLSIMWCPVLCLHYKDASTLEAIHSNFLKTILCVPHLTLNSFGVLSWVSLRFCCHRFWLKRNPLGLKSGSPHSTEKFSSSLKKQMDCDLIYCGILLQAIWSLGPDNALIELRGFGI